MYSCPNCSSMVGEYFSECPQCKYKLVFKCKQCGGYYYYADGGCTNCGRERIKDFSLYNSVKKKLDNKLSEILEKSNRLVSLIMMSETLGAGASLLKKQRDILKYLNTFYEKYLTLRLGIELDEAFSAEISVYNSNGNINALFGNFIDYISKIEKVYCIDHDAPMVRSIVNFYKNKYSEKIKLLIEQHTSDLLASISPATEAFEAGSLSVDLKDCFIQCSNLDSEFDRFMAEIELK